MQKTDDDDMRTLSGQLVSSFQQLRLTFIFIGGGILLLAAVNLYVLSDLRKQLVALDLSENIDPEISYPMMASLQQAQFLIAMVSILIFLIAVWRGFKLSHRIWGPMVAFRRHIGELKNGNYEARITLREGDEFFDLMRELNGLAEHLQKNSKS